MCFLASWVIGFYIQSVFQVFVNSQCLPKEQVQTIVNFQNPESVHIIVEHFMNQDTFQHLIVPADFLCVNSCVIIYCSLGRLLVRGLVI